MADVTGEESNGVLAIQVESRGELCATGTASLPAAAPSFSLSDFVEVAAVAERKPVNATSYALGKWLGTVPRAWAAMRPRNIWRISARPSRSTPGKGSATPACCRG